MDKLKAKLLDAMNQKDFEFNDLMKIIFEEVKEMQETIENQQDDLMRSMSVELEQRDKIKELKNTILELEAGNQNNIKEIDFYRGMNNDFNKAIQALSWELMWIKEGGY